MPNFELQNDPVVTAAISTAKTSETIKPARAGMQDAAPIGDATMSHAAQAYARIFRYCHVGIPAHTGLQDEAAIGGASRDANRRAGRLRSALLLGIALPLTGALAQEPEPNGPGGSWTLVWHDEFASDAALNTKNWDCMQGIPGPNSGSSMECSNSTVSGKTMNLVLASKMSQSQVCSDLPNRDHCQQGSGYSLVNVPNGYAVQVGQFIEAKIYFPGSGGYAVDWPAFYIAGLNWPADGENDIVEGAQGPSGKSLCITYHSPTVNHPNTTTQYCPVGNWTDAYHTFGLYRGSSSVRVYWDGVQEANYVTSDDGNPEQIFFQQIYANNPGLAIVYGSKSEVKVQYVRVWSGHL